jgi:protoheme IX farnesyltransferase
MNVRSFIRDFALLSKPSILFLNILMAAMGMWLALQGAQAPLVVDWFALAMTLVGVTLVVASANTFNMVLERDVDGLMRRTMSRPLPTGRIGPKPASLFGVVLGIVGTWITWRYGGVMTAMLGALALAIYVLVYTPLKRHTSLALVIGAIPGAAPPLMGWVAVTQGFELPGFALFAILLVWQIPHFLAIALYSHEDYQRAGIQTVPVVFGERIAKLQMVVYATLLIPLCLSLVSLGSAGWIYGAAALAVSVWFLVACVRGARTQDTIPWARGVFRASLVYLPVLYLALVLDGVIL